MVGMYIHVHQGTFFNQLVLGFSFSHRLFPHVQLSIDLTYRYNIRFLYTTPYEQWSLQHLRQMVRLLCIQHSFSMCNTVYIIMQMYYMYMRMKFSSFLCLELQRSQPFNYLIMHSTGQKRRPFDLLVPTPSCLWQGILWQYARHSVVSSVSKASHNQCFQTTD